MPHNLIKEIVELDKIAREKVSHIVDEKENINEVLAKYRIEVQKANEVEVKKALAKKQKALEAELKTREENAKLEFEANLKLIHENYDENKDTWIKEIFLACIKE